jgi:hypothetical protein
MTAIPPDASGPDRGTRTVTEEAAVAGSMASTIAGAVGVRPTPAISATAATAGPTRAPTISVIGSVMDVVMGFSTS